MSLVLPGRPKTYDPARIRAKDRAIEAKISALLAK
jgi:hypothetical protein